MKGLYNFIKSIAPYLLVLWIIIILVFSSISNLPQLRIITGRLNLKIDSFFHFSEYVALATLAVLSFAKNEISLRSRKTLIVLTGLFIFAALDETHQLLIPARSFEFKDMLFNFGGVFLGTIITLHLNRVY